VSHGVLYSLSDWDRPTTPSWQVIDVSSVFSKSLRFSVILLVQVLIFIFIFFPFLTLFRTMEGGGWNEDKDQWEMMNRVLSKRCFFW